MSLITPEQMAELDVLDANANAAAIMTDNPEPESVEVEAKEESTPDTESEAKTKEVVYREEIVEDDTSEKVAEPEVSGTEPLQLTDDTLVIDPLTGQQVTGRDLKNRMLMQADYTRKTQELSQKERDFNDRIESLEAKLVEKPVVEEDEYDPADPHDVAQRRTNDELRKTQIALSETQTQLREMNEAIQMRDHQNAMESFEKIKSDVLDAHKDVLTVDDIEPIGRQFMVEAETNPNLTYEDTANVYAERIRKAGEQAVSNWKQKYVVTDKPTGDNGSSPGPSTPPKLKLGNKSIIEAMDAQDRERAKASATGG